nr:MAG TPA: hypothetical protein [Caudoviricetes sp.]
MEIEKRNLDGAFFRIKRDGRWQNICFSDLTEEEMDAVLNGQTTIWLMSLCKYLGETLRRIGDKFDICCKVEREEEKHE